MKCLLLLLLLPFYSFSQDTLSVIDKYYSATPGAMIKKESVELGRVRNVVVKQYKLTNMRNEKPLYFVGLVQEGNMAVPSATVSITMDELKGVIESLEYMNKLSYKEKPDNNEEYYYTTANNLKMVLSQNTIYKGWIIGLGHLNYYNGQYKPNQHVYIKPSVFEELLPILKKAQNNTF